MSGEKKVFVFNGVTLRLYAPLDLSQKWYLEWYEGPKRRRKYGRINREKTYKGRMAAADSFAEELSLSLLPTKHVEQYRVEEYIASKVGEWRPSTITNHRSMVKVFFEWMGDREVTRANVEAFFVYLKKVRHTTTYNHYRAELDRLFTAVDRPNLFINVQRLRTHKTPARYFQPHQVERLKKVISEKDPQLWLYIQFVYYCFIRPGRELPKLTAGDIMLHERKIYIPGSKSKNKKTQYVSIPDAFFPKLSFIYDMGPGQYLFTQRWNKEKPIGRHTMSRRHREILTDLKFGKGYCLYSWKHTGAIQAIKAGIGVKELQIQLRHHSLDETDKYLRQMGVQDLSNLRTDFPAI